MKEEGGRMRVREGDDCGYRRPDPASYSRSRMTLYPDTKLNKYIY